MAKATRRLAGTSVIGGAVATLLLRRWKNNPGPHAGRAPVFPGERSVTVPTDDGAEITVSIVGAGPPVVLVHGITASSDDWGFVAESLVAAGHEVYGVNQRGHGSSTVGTEGFSAPRFGRDVRAVLERFDLNDAVLAGHSMGGIAAMSFMVDHHDQAIERLRGLVLVSTVPQGDAFLQRLALPVFKLDWSIADRAPALGRLIAGLAVFGKPKSLTMIDHAIDSASRTPAKTRAAAADGLASYNVRNRISQINVPTSVICGASDLVTPIRYSRFIARAIPGAQMFEYANAGHQIIWERSAEVAEHITDLSAVNQLV